MAGSVRGPGPAPANTEVRVRRGAPLRWRGRRAAGLRRETPGRAGEPSGPGRRRPVWRAIPPADGAGRTGAEARRRARPPALGRRARCPRRRPAGDRHRSPPPTIRRHPGHSAPRYSARPVRPRRRRGAAPRPARAGSAWRCRYRAGGRSGASRPRRRRAANGRRGRAPRWSSRPPWARPAREP